VAVQNAKDVLLLMLSDVRRGSERSANFFKEVVPLVQDPDVKQTLNARAFISAKNLETLDQCFKLLGEKPMKLDGRIYETFMEDFRNQLGEIQSPVAKRLFILSKINHLIHLRMGEYAALVAAAEATGNHGIGALLETNLADKHVFGDRVRRFIRERREASAAA
jgi:ferritin-like metal-binding protein YciE